ncbi:MAG TPA: hypothetical protein VNT03_05855 [Baekduia sp.]|nr:hypothetical protein [Baekduia sp.]
MRLTTTTTHVSVDGVKQGLGAPDEDRSGGAQRAPALRNGHGRLTLRS